MKLKLLADVVVDKFVEWSKDVDGNTLHISRPEVVLPKGTVIEVEVIE